MQSKILFEEEVESNLAEFVRFKLESNPNDIFVYAGAYHLAMQYEDAVPFDVLTGAINGAIKNAKFFVPSVKPSAVARKFCHLLMVDPMLLEVYLGIRLEALDK